MKKDSSGKDKPDVEKDDPHRQIIPRLTGAGREVFDWLETIFDLSENDAEPGKVKTGSDLFPDSVQLKMAGRGGIESGQDIMSFDFKPSSSQQPSREKLVEMANAFVRKAQQDADALGHSQRYGLFAYSNLKGAGAYSRHLFNIDGASKRDAASDDEDSHRDRLLSTALAHSRWQQEQFSEAISGVMSLQRDIIRQQQTAITQMEADRRQWIIAYEDSLSKKQEREMAAEFAKFKMAAFETLLEMAKPLVPAVQAYLTKGKVGILEGIRKFLDSLSETQRVTLFGSETTLGILEAEQRDIILNIADGNVEPKRLAEFIQGLKPEQFSAAQEALNDEQVTQLMSLAHAAQSAA